MAWPFLDAQEQALVEEGLPLTGERRPGLVRALARLGRVAQVAWDSAPELSPDEIVQRLGGSRYDADFRLPPEAAVGQAFLLAKAAFLGDLAVALGGAGEELRRRAGAEHAQSIHSRLAEELFHEVAGDVNVDLSVRHAAARKLSRLWNDPVWTEIDDVAPLLDAIWDARCRLRPVLGTLLGTHEVLELFRSTRDERFLDHFTRDDVPEEELQAFQEFLLGLSTEEHATLRAEMSARGVSVLSLADAHEILGIPDDGSELSPGRTGPEAMVASYRARKVKASYRILARVPGPRRTAEEHVVIARLARGQAL